MSEKCKDCYRTHGHSYYCENQDLSTPEARAVCAIIKDLSDRRGLDNEWDAIDDDIQTEIVERWKEIIKEEFSK